ncbi:Demethylmenaquinone methyltransferase [Thermoflexales bacterium]|nr:Demethylmenaquinone methyltransferase [Thermoflexales bacterium]
MPFLLILLLLALIGLFLYWQLVWAEGTYLGKRPVAWLYNLVAHRYNDIKQYADEDDARYLGEPLALSLQGTPDPIVLDVATGTSRLPLALCRQPLFRGQIVALDNARRMLHTATDYLRDYRDRVTWVWQHAVPLPFDDDTFDVVTCLEAFEFMPNTRDALRECLRVLKPGGLLLVTNRVGSGRWLLFGKTFSREGFVRLLQAFGQIDVTTQVWQYDYDLVWSIKPDENKTSEVSPAPLRYGVLRKSFESLNPSELLRCPKCGTPFDRTGAALTCRSCGRRYPIGTDGVIELL